MDENKIGGAIKLSEHQFSRTLRDSKINNLQNPVYLIERDNNGLKITQLENQETKSGKNNGFYQVSKSLIPIGYIVLIIFSTATIIIIGIWLFRRKKRKLD